ncbi:MAG: hypothetical protein ABW250_26835 [Pyrinomonadaceae bacterium]
MKSLPKACAALGFCVALLLLTSVPQTSKAQTEGMIVAEDVSVIPTTNRLTKWTARRLISNSLLSDDGTNITLNGATGARLIFPNFSFSDSSALGGHMQLRNAAGSAYAKSRMAALLVTRSDDSLSFDVGNTADVFGVGSGGVVAFASGTNAAGAKDTSASRAAAGVWQFGDGGANANGRIKSLSAQIGTATAKGTCDSSARGTLYTEFGGAGVADKIYQCMKGSADTYSWVQIVSAP